MIFSETKLSGAFVIAPQKLQDERGFFARTWSTEAFEQRGMTTEFVQCSVSFNDKAGTLRGMHYQIAPHAEAKLVRCTRGAMYDVVLDLRPESPTFLQWVAETLTAENHNMLFVPEGCAHGFQTLEDDSEVFYQISVAYAPQCARGVRWDDPAFGIEWPACDLRTMSARDREYPNFDEADWLARSS